MVAAVFGLVVTGWRLSPGEAARRGGWWIADRGAGGVYRLDAALIETARYSVSSPVGVLPRETGGLWVLSAVEGDPAGIHEVLEIVGRDAERGSVRWRGRVAAVYGFVRAGEGAVYLLVSGVDGSSGAQLWRVGSAGIRQVEVDRAATALAARGARIAIGTADGRVLVGVRDASRAGAITWLMEQRLGDERSVGAVENIAPVDGGGWWIHSTGPDQLMRLSGGLEMLGTWALPCAPGGLVCRGAEAWVAGAAGRELLVARVGRPLWSIELPAVGFAPLSGFGDWVLCAAPGAAVLVDGRGDVTHSQGGFDFLADAASSP